ncbi:epoxyqueuosine reductase QueH [candidate division KSB1 bacterium]|nr:epoxyqueuosine reductase QueH [candidate division KSB1 bacterium]
MSNERKKLLLHACCAPCVTHPIRLLSETYQTTAYFYNPNIHPKSEYEARRDEIVRLGKKWGFEVIPGDYDADEWFEAVKGHEDDPEGGARCTICYRMRLQKTAELAREMDFDLFTTTLSISPLKKAELINEIGKKIQTETGITFLETNLKKKDGFKISCQLSKDEGLYRQDYCGCIYSQKKDIDYNASSN